jgi:hypothetical protein
MNLKNMMRVARVYRAYTVPFVSHSEKAEELEGCPASWASLDLPFSLLALGNSATTPQSSSSLSGESLNGLAIG